MVDLRSLYAGTSPVVSVYLSLVVEPTATERALPLRWRALRGHLEVEGARDDQLAALDARVAAANPVDRTLVAFARDRGLEWSDELVDFGGYDTAAIGPVPVGVPLLRWRAERVPYVVAVVDRVGADLAAYDATGALVGEQVVVGLDDEVERNAPGGWAQRRYQHRAEDSWAHNAAQVTRHLTGLTALVRAKLVVAAGDVRAVQLLADHLAPDVRRRLRTVSAGLEQVGEGRVRVRREAVCALVREAAARDRAEIATAFAETAGSKDVVTGAADTAEALRRGAVRHLLVVDRPGDARTGWVSSDPLRFADVEVATGHLADARAAPLREAMVRAAFAQSAAVSVFDAAEVDVPDGFGAFVRF